MCRRAVAVSTSISSFLSLPLNARSSIFLFSSSLAPEKEGLRMTVSRRGAAAAASALLRCLTPRSNPRLHRGPASLASFHPSAGGAAETAEAAAAEAA